MAVPTLNSVGADLYDRVSPLAYDDETQDYALAHFANAAGTLLSEIDGYVRDDIDGNPGWSILLDPYRAPAKGMRWLGQMAGASFAPQGAMETEADYLTRARAALLGGAGLQRGTPGAIRAAAQAYLTGTKTVYLRERDTDAYHLTVNTRQSETPTEDWAATNLLINGGFESNITNWGAIGTGVTIARETTLAKFGGASLKIVADGTVGDQGAGTTGAAPAMAASSVYTLSTYAYSVGGGEKLTLRIFEMTAGSTFIQNQYGPTVTLVPGWQRLSFTFTTSATTGQGSSAILTNHTGGTVAGTFWIDGVQLEANSAATPYLETNGATASRPSGTGPVGVALAAAKPAGLVMVYAPIPGQDWQNVLNTRATWQAVKNAYGTWDAVRTG